MQNDPEKKVSRFPPPSVSIATKVLENSIYQEKRISETNLLSENTKDIFIS